MKKKILYAPPILEIFVMGAEANFCVSTNLNKANTGINAGYVNDYSDLTFE